MKRRYEYRNEKIYKKQKTTNYCDCGEFDLFQKRKCKCKSGPRITKNPPSADYPNMKTIDYVDVIHCMRCRLPVTDIPIIKIDPDDYVLRRCKRNNRFVIEHFNYPSVPLTC